MYRRVRCQVTGVTEKAVQIHVKTHAKSMWVPRSLCRDGLDIDRTYAVLFIKSWFVRRELGSV